MSESRCLHCSKTFEPGLPASVNVGRQPELKEEVLSGKFFLRECPHCGEVNLVKGDFLYLDPGKELLVCLSDSRLNAPEELPGYVCRQVGAVGELIEKIKIADAGLDDIAVEMCKLVTAQELGKDVDLKFYSLDGADGEIIFAYPQDSRMEMVAVGFNVYEDCRGILGRNPSITTSAKGLCRIDKAWISQFFR